MVLATLLLIAAGLYCCWGVYQWFRLAWNLWKPAPTGFAGEELRKRRASPPAPDPKLWN